MGRPIKQTVDYFPHDSDASDGRTLTILFNNFGHEAISAWWQLLERVSRTNNHVINIRNLEDIEFLAAKMKFQPEILKNILDKMAELGAIDSELYINGIIWSQNLVDRLEAVYKNRGQQIPRKPIISTNNKTVSIGRKSITNNDNTQSKVNKSKVNKIIIPEWIDKNTWDEFIKMRNQIKAPLTDRAKELAIIELEKLRNNGYDPNEILNRSIMNSWKGLFAPNIKGDNNVSGKGRLPKRYQTPEERDEERKKS